MRLEWEAKNPTVLRLASRCGGAGTEKRPMRCILTGKNATVNPDFPQQFAQIHKKRTGWSPRIVAQSIRKHLSRSDRIVRIARDRNQAFGKFSSNCSKSRRIPILPWSEVQVLSRLPGRLQGGSKMKTWMLGGALMLGGIVAGVVYDSPTADSPQPNLAPDASATAAPAPVGEPAGPSVVEVIDLGPLLDPPAAVARAQAPDSAPFDPQTENAFLPFASNKFDAWTISHRVDTTIANPPPIPAAVD